MTTHRHKDSRGLWTTSVTDPNLAPYATDADLAVAIAAVEAQLALLDQRIEGLEVDMANVKLYITQNPGPVTPPLPPDTPPPIPPDPPPDPIDPVTPPVNPAGATCYISPSGSDSSGDGTISAPWLTIQHWIDSAPVAGDTLYCRGGTYSSPAAAVAGHGTNALQGTSGAHITIAAYPGETPLFTGGNGPFIGIAGRSYYVDVDGLWFADRSVNQSSYVYIGAWDTVYVTHHIVLRNIHLTLKAGQDQSAHGFYVSSGCEYITIEDCVLLGPGSGGGGGGGIHLYHDPQARNILFQRNIMDGWANPSGGAGIVLWDNGNQVISGRILHNTFKNNAVNIDARHHGTLLVRDNAGTTATQGSAFNLYDPNNSGSTTADHNFWGQTFDASYHLDSGDSGWKAASDGTDAGALNS